MNIPSGKKVYFASDQHLGVPDFESSLKREKHFVKWLHEAQQDAAAIYLMGDLFDFWFEYASVIPRGFTRVLGKISEITDKGIPVYFFRGNHDMWTFDYLVKECGVQLYDGSPLEVEMNGKSFLIGHGDGLGPGDFWYKQIKAFFANPFMQWCFARLHPNFGVGLANYFSRSSRAKNATADKTYHGDDKEWLVQFVMEEEKKKHRDYYVFGHRHYAMDKELGNNSHYINLGDWVVDFTYAVFDGEKLELKAYGKPQ
ncbi:MAG: UDP-2,3-diacylglucosamine diphosphatase [Salibacteraceae bacterium]